MTLRDYLAKTGTRPADFADKLHVTPTCIYDWIAGRRRPSLHLSVQVERVTNGEVRPRDFLVE